MALASVQLNEGRRRLLFKNIVHILDEMPGDLRDAFILSHYRGAGDMEIASRLQISKGELAGRLKKANSLFYRKLRISG